MSRNYSLYSIPAYLVLAMMPHIYSVSVVVQNNNLKWRDLRTSPRSKDLDSKVKQSAPATCYAKYERCRAAHNNMLENMAFMVGAVLAGNMAKLDARWMNAMMGWYLASRVAYIFSYVQAESKKYAPLRTVFYLAGSIQLLAIYIRAAGVLAENGVT